MPQLPRPSPLEAGALVCGMTVARQRAMSSPTKPPMPPKITHPELAPQPGEAVPRTSQTPAEADEIGRKAQEHNQVEPKRRAR